MTHIHPQPRYTPDQTVAMASAILQMKIDTDAIIPPTEIKYDVRSMGGILMIDDTNICGITATYAQVCDAIDRWARLMRIDNN